MKKFAFYILTLVLIASVAGTCFACSGSTDTEDQSGKLLPKQERFRVATTTSLYDTGLWSLLEPMFEEEYNVELDILYAGTGIALTYGRNGDVDAITVHDRASELQFVADGYAEERVPFAYNYFLVVGPESDPAGIKGLSPEEAFTILAEDQSASFVSRGDNSGTHSKEKAIWVSAGYTYSDIQISGSWYIEAGIGMGPTLAMADEKQGYTLTDMGTYLAYKGNLDLVPIVDSGSILLNVYSVMACTKGKNPAMAQNLVEFLTSDKVQQLIEDYGTDEYGESLFIPCAGNEPTN